MLRAWLNAKGNCASSAITGGSGFNVRRAEKMNSREENHGKAFFAWRERVLNAWRKEADRRQKESTIQAAGGEAALMRQQVEAAKADHEKRKAANKEIAKAKKEGRDISQWLLNEFNLAPHMLGHYLQWGVVSATATANIRRMEQRVKELEEKEARQAEGTQETKVSGAGWELIENKEVDRYQFIFDAKPDEATRSMLKSNGYKWAPSQNAWQRQITGNAAHATRRILEQLPK